jgi:hypothetical protein
MVLVHGKSRAEQRFLSLFMCRFTRTSHLYGAWGIGQLRCVALRCLHCITYLSLQQQQQQQQQQQHELEQEQQHTESYYVTAALALPSYFFEDLSVGVDTALSNLQSVFLFFLFLWWSSIACSMQLWVQNRKRCASSKAASRSCGDFTLSAGLYYLPGVTEAHVHDMLIFECFKCCIQASL